MKCKEAHLEPSQTSKMDLFAKLVNVSKSLTIFAKSSILDVWQGPEYAPGIQKKKKTSVKSVETISTIKLSSRTPHTFKSWTETCKS